MITVEKLAPVWRDAFLASRNSLFTPIDAAYCDRVEKPASLFPVRTFIGRDESKVVSWGSFFLRRLATARENTPALKVAMACAIGTLPDYQRQGLAGKIWRAAEQSLAGEIDALLIYTGEGGKGYLFYRAMGYLPLLYPRPLRLTVGGEAAAQPRRVRTMPFAESRIFSRRRADVFASCYHGYGGYMADRPGSLDCWADVSFFYDPATTGCQPQISWLEDTKTGQWFAYAIWAGPIEKVGWKKDAVELWELARTRDCDPALLRDLLQPACAAARNGNGQLDWWAVPDHGLTQQMIAMGFVERPRSLCVLGKVLDPAKKLGEQLQVECTGNAGQRVDIHMNDCHVEIESDAAIRMVLGRSTASLEYQRGSLTIYPLVKTPTTLEALDRALPIVPWTYFASEFI
jgi:GNAT superfamily N-acetyltransferase